MSQHPARTVVFLHAHPDDEAIFTGATMRRLVDHGHRVVLVTATDGGEGVPLRPLRPGESMADRRLGELQDACAELGVDRLVPLGYRDSGMPGDAANHHPRAYVNAGVTGEARRLAALLQEEGADTLVHYDGDGIYGHPDHVMVHRVGALAAALAGVTAYEATVDREHLHFVDTHLVSDAKDDSDAREHAPAARLGRASVEITTTLRATPAELAVKRAAMVAHSSQIASTRLDGDGFAATYEHEWYVHARGAATLDVLRDSYLVGASPVATGRVSSAPHWDHEPG